MSREDNYRDLSRKKLKHTADRITHDDLQSSALMRIADAAELMAKRSADLERDMIYYKGRSKYWRERYERISRKLQAQKALSSRYKNRLDRLDKELEVLQEENNNLR